MPPLSPDRWRAAQPVPGRGARDRRRANARPGWRPFARATRRSPPICSALLAEHDAVHESRFLERAVPLPPRAALAPSLAGQVLGAYRLVSLIGQGGMGSVWLAERCDGRFEGRAAVKLLNIALIGRAGEERFRREGTILARLHPSAHRAPHRRRRLADRPALSRPRARRRPDASTATATSTRSGSRPASACFSTCSRRSRTRTPT